MNEPVNYIDPDRLTQDEEMLYHDRNKFIKSVGFNYSEAYLLNTVISRLYTMSTTLRVRSRLYIYTISSELYIYNCLWSYGQNQADIMISYDFDLKIHNVRLWTSAALLFFSLICD